MLWIRRCSITTVLSAKPWEFFLLDDVSLILRKSLLWTVKFSVYAEAAKSFYIGIHSNCIGILELYSSGHQKFSHRFF